MSKFGRFARQTNVTQGKFIESLSPDEGYFRGSCKSQNINPISPTPTFNLGIKIKSLSTILVLRSIRKYLSVYFQHLTFQPTQRSGVCSVSILNKTRNSTRFK